MNTRQVRNAIMSVLEREICKPGWTYEDLGEKIELVLHFSQIKKRQKDKDAPKKTRTAYTFFCQKNRAETVEEMEKVSGEEPVKSVDVVRALAKRWKELKLSCENGDKDAIYEMEGYKEKSKQDGERYSTENAAYEGSIAE